MATPSKIGHRSSSSSSSKQAVKPTTTNTTSSSINANNSQRFQLKKNSIADQVTNRLYTQKASNLKRPTSSTSTTSKKPTVETTTSNKASVKQRKLSVESTKELLIAEERQPTALSLNINENDLIDVNNNGQEDLSLEMKVRNSSPQRSLPLSTLDDTILMDIEVDNINNNGNNNETNTATQLLKSSTASLNAYSFKKYNHQSPPQSAVVVIDEKNSYLFESQVEKEVEAEMRTLQSDSLQFDANNANTVALYENHLNNHLFDHRDLDTIDNENQQHHKLTSLNVDQNNQAQTTNQQQKDAVKSNSLSLSTISTCTCSCCASCIMRMSPIALMNKAAAPKLNKIETQFFESESVTTSSSTLLVQDDSKSSLTIKQQQQEQVAEDDENSNQQQLEQPIYATVKSTAENTSSSESGVVQAANLAVVAVEENAENKKDDLSIFI